MRDFTLHTFKLLLSTLREHNYKFQTFAHFLRNPASRSVILRHDVDARKMNSLICAQLEKELGITGTYYFRIIPDSFDEELIKQIYALRHEIGYHYEDLVFARQKGLAQSSGRRAQSAELRAQGSGRRLRIYATKSRKAGVQDDVIEKEIVDMGIESFKKNLDRLRRIVPVETICMHGSPLSRWDNRLLWKYYDYRDFGIEGEPYFDIDFDKVLYLTDTGRRWDGEAVSIRDKAQGAEHRAQSTEHRAQSTGRRFHSTFDIIAATEENKLPDQIMLTIHPQRWNDRTIPWIKELVWQNTKNVGKRIINEFR
ncbi:MAG TPA: hypothetical protein PK910_00735 [Bacteroidales bacterium]|nr:hypothetical protein [Bacteroidales bacterium]HRC88534.1 hypothetical protein [Bacteroidales bacterium]